MKSVHYRRKEKLLILLESVRSEIVFELDLADHRNGYPAGSPGEDGREPEDL